MQNWSIDLNKDSDLEKAETVAFNAEKEITDMMYTDTGLFKDRQFQYNKPIVLKTTYDEIGILWNQPMRFRPHFQVVDNVVKAATIFAELEGVPCEDKKDYFKNLMSFVIKDTVFCPQLPLIADDSQRNDVERTKYLKFLNGIQRLNEVDFVKLKQSEYYTYHVFSQETQELICKKVQELLNLDWCVNSYTDITTRVLDVVFSLPISIVLLIHNYDLTGNVPKLVLYSGDTNVCSLEDSILIMFLKLIGFDILVFSPSGYALLGQYIKESLFNKLVIGSYMYDMADVDFKKIKSKKKK